MIHKHFILERKSKNLKQVLLNNLFKKMKHNFYYYQYYTIMTEINKNKNDSIETNHFQYLFKCYSYKLMVYLFKYCFIIKIL